MNNSESNKRIARNTLFLYIRMGVVMLIALYTTRVVLRVLGNEDYGVYNVVCGFVAMFGIFNTCFSTGINRFYNFELGKKSEEGIRKVYNCAVLIQTVIAILIVIIVEIVGVWYVNNKMILPGETLITANWIFQFSIVSMFLTVMQAPYSAAIMAYEKMDYYALVSILDAFVKLGFVIMLQFVGQDKLLIYGFLMCVISVINFLLYYIYCKLKFPDIRLHKGIIDKKMVKSMITFSGWSALDPVAYMARDQGTNMVLNVFFGPTVNAAQGIAYQTATAVDSFSGSFSTSFRPQIIQSYSEGNYSRTKNLMFSMSKISYILQIMLAVPIIIEIDYILRLWLGDGYPPYAASFACLVLVIKSIGTLNAPISNVVSATGNIRIIKIFSAIVIASIVPISILLFKVGMSPIFLYITLLLLTIFNQIGCIIIMSKVFPPIKPLEYIKEIALPLLTHSICIIIMPLIVWWGLQPSFGRLSLVAGLSVIGSVVFGYLLVLNNTERIMARYFLVSFIKKLKIITIQKGTRPMNKI